MEVRKFEVGMYGGKFLPFHKGHAYCIDVCCAECEEPHMILFVNGADEDRIGSEGCCDPGFRAERMARYLERNHPHARLHVIDLSGARNPDGREDWDAETPLVRAILPHIDAIYSSEPSYGPYFARAYPEAVHRLVDPDRMFIPISGTQVRKMDSREAMRWIMRATSSVP